MNIATYCKDKGMNLQEFQDYKAEIQREAKEILENIKNNYPVDTGMYFETTEIIDNELGDIRTLFIIQELKKLEVEFMENNKLFRF